MYSTVSENFKNECKQDVNQYKRIAKIHVVEDNIDITNDNALVDFTIEETAYSESTFIGNSVAKKLDLNIINDGTYNLENKEVEVYVGIDYEGDGSNTELVPYGNFIISKPTNEEVKNASNYVGYDYMIKAETPYVEDNIVYPMSLYNYLSAICTTLGLTLGNVSIPNGNYQVLGNAYTNGESFRQVIEEIATCCGGFAVIGRDNKLYIRTLVRINDNEDDEITPGEYFEDFGTNNEYGPINRVAIALTYNVIGEDTIREDGDSIVRDGLTAIRVSDISFLNSEAQRELAIDNFWTQLHNLKYVPFSAEYYGYPYLDSGDIVKIKLPNNNYAYSYVFNHKFSYNGAFSGKIETSALSDVEKEYDYSPTAKSALRNTELRVDKINGQITSIINEIGDRSDKQTSITQDIDSIELKISDLEDLTLEVQGLNPIQLDNCMAGELIELRIFGNNTVFGGLHPRDDLYPSETLYPMGDSFLKIYTDNICPDTPDKWSQYYDDNKTLVSEAIPTKWQKTCISIENSNYKISGFEAISQYGLAVEKTADDPMTNVIDWDSYDLQEYDSFKLYIQRVDGEDITLEEITDIKPMVTYSDHKLNYVKYNVQEIDLKIDEPLREYSSTVYDEIYYDANYLYDLEEGDDDDTKNRCVLIRKVGVSQGGELYPLAQPIYQVLDIGPLMLVSGTNYIDVGNNYTANLYARYVQITDFTKIFATQYQLTSQILQLANAITLLVQEKVGNDEVIAKINIAVQDRQGIIDILGNQIKIKSDNFELTEDGHIIAKAGTIAGWNITPTRLYKSRSGIASTNDEKGLVFYAGADEGTINNSKFRVLNNGETTAQLLHIECEAIGVNNSDGIHIYYNKKLGVVLDPYGMNFIDVNDTSGDYTLAELSRNSGGSRVGFWLYRADGFEVVDGTTVLFYVSKTGVDINKPLSVNDTANFYGTTNIYGNLMISGSISSALNGNIIITSDTTEYGIQAISHGGNTIHFNGKNGTTYSVTASSSDRKLKKNIKETEIKSAVELINKIKHYSFDWKENGEHQKIGYIANELYETDDSLAFKVEQTENCKYKELYNYNTATIMALSTKAIQELSEENKKLKEKLDDLEKRLSKLEGGK